jgi:hypothetical protein
MSKTITLADPELQFLIAAEALREAAHQRVELEYRERILLLLRLHDVPEDAPFEIKGNEDSTGATLTFSEPEPKIELVTA